MQRLGGGGYTRKNKRGGGNDPSCGCDMQAGWPKFLTENIPLPSQRGGSKVTTDQRGGSSCAIPPIPNYYQGGGGCAACAGLPLPTPIAVGNQQGGGQPTVYNSNPVPDACPFPGTGYCNFYAKGGSLPSLNGGANYGEPMYLQARLRGGAQGLPLGLSAAHLALQDERKKRLSEAIRLLQQEGKPLTSYNIRQKLRQINAERASSAAPMARPVLPPQNGGGCGCGLPRGGYRPTKKNLAALKKWRKGQSIGFTMTSSLKAKGLIPRTSRKHKGKKVVSAKYK